MSKIYDGIIIYDIYTRPSISQFIFSTCCFYRPMTFQPVHLTGIKGFNPFLDLKFKYILSFYDLSFVLIMMYALLCELKDIFIKLCRIRELFRV